MSDAERRLLVRIADSGPLVQGPSTAVLGLLRAGLVIRGEAVGPAGRLWCWGLTEAGWRARQDVARGAL